MHSTTLKFLSYREPCKIAGEFFQPKHEVIYNGQDSLVCKNCGKVFIWKEEDQGYYLKHTGEVQNEEDIWDGSDYNEFKAHEL